MPCDSGCNCDSFNAVVGAFQSLRARYEPSYVICGGDFNVDLSRVQSSQTVMIFYPVKTYLVKNTIVLLIHCMNILCHH